ncbi:MAG: GldG family protein [Clostridiaceae bacterium]|nr:GldG family protein [Clostridiaceae bacterium]
MRTLKKLLRDRKFRHGASATMVTAIFIAALIAINLLIGNYHLNIDLTKDKIFTLSGQTLKVLKELKQPVTIYALYRQGNETPEIKEILDRYEMGSPNIKVEYVDPSKDTDFVNKYAEKGYAIYNGTIIIERGGKCKVISPNDIVDYNTYTQEARSLLVEQRITSSIASVANEKETIVYFVEGHEEASLSLLKQILEMEGIKTGTVQLADQEIPEDAQLLLVSAPVFDFEESEIEKLDAYLNKGGRAAFLFHISLESLPNLEDYLKKWGVALHTDVVVEGDSQYFFQDITNLIPEMKEHPITSVLKKGKWL